MENFPLKLADGTKARNLKALQEHFDLTSIIQHYCSHRLQDWLLSLGYGDLAANLDRLVETNSNFQQMLCDILGVDSTAQPVDINAVRRQQERLEKLRQYTDDAEVLKHVDQVAFNQEELANLLDAGVEQIYLCGDQFTVLASLIGKTYTGINQPQVHINGVLNTQSDLVFMGIQIDNWPVIEEPEQSQAHDEQSTPYLVEPEEVSLAVVDHIETEAGDKGFRTPQIYFENPAVIDGVKYDHVPVLSAKLFDDLGLRQGSIVKVHRVGDVIPSITMEEEGKGKKLQLPTRCPFCREEMIHVAKKLYCKNAKCKANIKGRFNTFFEVLELKDYSDSFAEKLVAGGVKSLGQMLKLTVTDLNNMDINGKLADEFPKAVRAAVESAPDYIVVAAMGLAGIGRARAKMLIKAVPFHKLATINTLDLSSALFRVFGGGGGAEASLTEMLVQSSVRCNRELFAELEPYVKNITKNFDNVLVVGHSGVEPSAETKKFIKELGYELTDGKSFNFLLVKDDDVINDSVRHTAKIKKALDKGIPIFSQEAFIEMFTPEPDDEEDADDTFVSKKKYRDGPKQILDNIRFDIKTKILKR